MFLSKIISIYLRVFSCFWVVEVFWERSSLEIEILNFLVYFDVV